MSAAGIGLSCESENVHYACYGQHAELRDWSRNPCRRSRSGTCPLGMVGAA